MTKNGPVVLITGSSGGIGRATALLLAEKGCHVLASARRPETVRDLQKLADSRGWWLKTLPLDVNDSDSIATAVDAIKADSGRLDILVNNAGYGLYGPAEVLSRDEIRRQFETNVFGLLELTQKVIPIMRAQGRGRIINISSMGGRISTMFAGVYCASKFALEALSDALRMELSIFGIEVVVVEPGPTRSNFAQTTLELIEPLRQDAQSPYAPFVAMVQEIAKDFARQEVPPEDVARVVWQAISARCPKTRYPVGFSLKVFDALRRFLPDRLLDKQMKRMFRYSEATLKKAGSRAAQP